jgi:hypothetical protein
LIGVFIHQLGPVEEDNRQNFHCHCWRLILLLVLAVAVMPVYLSLSPFDRLVTQQPTMASTVAVGVCERAYESNGERLTQMMSMCIGIISCDDERALGDCLAEPYSSMKFRKKVIPTQTTMVDEVRRRSIHVDSTQSPPSCKYWPKDKLIRWLTENPVTVEEDVVFLQTAEKRLFDSVTKAKAEQGKQKEDNGESRNASWVSNDPYLRLYHCMFHEDLRAALLRMGEVLPRPCLDARNSDVRPETFFEGCARIFNDTTEVFLTEALPDLHYLFAHSIVLDFDDMPGPIEAEEVKKRFASARAQLIKIISKWELSGNGFGQRASDEDDFGHMTEDNFEAGDNRGNFLDCKTKEHILYFWHMADKAELLKNVLCVIADASAADTDNCASTTEPSTVAKSAARNRKAEARAASDFRAQIGDAMSSMSLTAMMQELREAEQQSMKYQELAITTDNPRLIALYSKYTDREEQRIEDLQEAVDRIRRRKITDDKMTDNVPRTLSTMSSSSKSANVSKDMLADSSSEDETEFD